MVQYESLYRNMLKEHEAVFAAQPQEEIDTALDLFEQSDRIFVIGAGREGIAARGFSMRLMHLGKEVHWLWDDTTPGMGVGDLFIAVNGSGKIGHIDYLLDEAGKRGTTRLVITGAPAERTPREAEYTLFVPAAVYKGTDARCISSAQPMGNLFEQHLFLLFDLMIMMLMDRMRLSPEKMELRHRNVE